MINKSISVVTVTLNDEGGLTDTLNSLYRLKTTPSEIIVVDGGSTKSTIDNILEEFSIKLPQLTIISEPDKGIYDAMNKGHNLAKGKLIHYLNSGDTVFGDPYFNLDSESLLPVQFIDEEGKECGSDKLKLHGTAYNHQGIIFKHNHFSYNLKFKIAADYLSILHSFPDGLSKLPLVNSGGVMYTLGGVSTNKTVTGSIEMIIALILNKPFYAVFLVPEIILKILIPKKFRRFILRNFRKNIF
jgi:glycosyltransferase involved in cell wall biosynthesis